MIEVKKSICTWCKGECGVLVYVENGRLLKVEPDPNYPVEVYPSNKGCPRLLAAKEWFYHPGRLNYPLKRVGERGEGKWERISWDQALDEIAAKLKEIKEKYGPEAIAATHGTEPRTVDIECKARFFSILGSPNIVGQATVCFAVRALMAEVVCGMFPLYSVKSTSRCIVLLGCEPLISRPKTAKIILEARKRGAKLIVIDPRRTKSASMADVWLKLRPGTDAALLLGMINVIIEEELYDNYFVENWCYGFNKLKERIKEYPLEKVEKITRVPKDKIREAARMYATNKPGVMIEGMGIEHLPNNAQALHARWILAALTGNIDVEGGEELTGPHPKMRKAELTLMAMEAAWRMKQLGCERFKLFQVLGRRIISDCQKKVWCRPTGITQAHGPTLYRAILEGKPYPIKALITSDSNPMVTQANTKLVYKALKSLNLELYVVFDCFMTPSAMLADYVLPAASWLERPVLWNFDDYAPYTIFGEAALPSCVPGEYDRRNEYEFWRELGLRLGQREYWPWKNLEECYDWCVKEMGQTFKNLVHNVRYEHRNQEFKKYEKINPDTGKPLGFATPTGKVELYSTILEKLGYDPLPYYEEPSESPISNPELAEKFPYTLITGGRTRQFFHSEWRNVQSVRKLHPYPLVQIHPETAKKLGINEGDWVWIETLRGKVLQKATLFDGMDPDIIHAEHGWWYPELPAEEPWLGGVWLSNINVCTNDDPNCCNQQIGTWPLRTALCRIYKAAEISNLFCTKG
ncbi:MAG: molybdopterin-dependent oxidoreductase [Candidatus Bathyarchaeia archaeon]